MSAAAAPDRPSPAARVRGAFLAIPGIRLVATYDRSWLAGDGLAAITVWALLVPQSLAYAQLGGFDPAVGLYACIGALIGYLLFGGAREMSVGPEATIAIMTATVIAPLAEGDATRYLALGAGLALVSGILLVLAGLARLGFVTRYLSRPLLTGYVAGSAIVIIVSQLDSLLGITLEASEDTIAELVETIQKIPEADTLTLAIGLVTIAIAVLVRRLDRRLPAYLIAVLAAILLSVVLDLEAKGVAVVGTITAGLPPLGLPALGLEDLAALVLPAAAIALLIYADSGVTGQVLARRGRYRVDPNGEFIGLGAANIGAGLTSGFPVNGSQSRSFAAADLGARSQLASAGVLVLLVITLLFLTPLFAPLPKSALAGVIIVVGVGLIHPAEFRSLSRIARSEAILALLAATIVVFVGMLAGVIVVAILSLLLLAQRAAQPRTVMLVRVPGTDTYRAAEANPDGSAEPGLVLYRFDAPLFFANVDILGDEILAAVEAASPPARWVVVDMEAVTDVDSTATESLLELVAEVHRRDVGFAVARLRQPVADYLDRAGVLDLVGHEHVYLQVDDAVGALRDMRWQGAGQKAADAVSSSSSQEDRS